MKHVLINVQNEQIFALPATARPVVLYLGADIKCITRTVNLTCVKQSALFRYAG